MPHSDKEKLKTFHREYYQKNKAKRNNQINEWMKTESGKASRKRSREKIKKFVADQKEPCIQCGWFEHPCGIDWHHVDPSIKSFELSRAFQHGIAKVKDEIAKCVCLCKNCHSMYHNGVIEVAGLPPHQGQG